MNPAKQSEGVYRSGVAARLAGIPVDTLRIWERRYSIIGPPLSAGRQRLYSAADIRRLKTIKQLVDMGHPIGTIASLDTEALLGIQAATWPSLNTDPGKAIPETHGGISVALVGPLLAGEQFGKALAGDAISVAARCADLEKAVADLKNVSAQIVIIELPTLRDADLGRVSAIKAACSATTAIVLYRFANSAIVRRMRMAGHAVARSMSDAAELEAICVDLMRRPRLDSGDALRLLASTQPRAPRFDEPTLARLSGASRTIECECPRHLVDLVMGLGGFENYSAECASRNPSDAVLHLDLQRAAGLARSIMEQALERLAIAEGIPFSAAPAANP